MKNETLKMSKTVSFISISIFLLTILVICFTNFILHPSLYKGCINACSENEPCLESAFDVGNKGRSLLDKRLNNTKTACMIESIPTCQLICVKKYK